MVRCKCEIDGTILARRPTQKEQTDVLFLVQSIEFPELALKELRTFRHWPSSSIDYILAKYLATSFAQLLHRFETSSQESRYLKKGQNIRNSIQIINFQGLWAIHRCKNQLLEICIFIDLFWPLTFFPFSQFQTSVIQMPKELFNFGGHSHKLYSLNYTILFYSTNSLQFSVFWLGSL